MVTRKEHFTPGPDLAPDYQYRLTFEFPVDGGERVPASASVTEGTFAARQVGDRLAVRYDPANRGRNLEVAGHTDAPSRFLRQAGSMFLLCAVFSGTFAWTPRRRRALLCRIAGEGEALTATVQGVTRLPLLGTRVTAVHADAAGKERRRTFSVPAAQAADYAVGTRVTLLRHPRMSWLVVPRRMVPYRFV